MIPIRITHDDPANPRVLHLGIHRQDIAPGEPGSLLSEHTLQPGESALLTVYPGAVITASEGAP